MRSKSRAAARIDSEHLLLLRALLLLAVVASIFLAAWHYNLVQRVWLEDRTGLSIAITIIFVLAASHGGLHVLRLSRSLNDASAVECYIEHHGQAAYWRGVDVIANGTQASGLGSFPRGCVTEYVSNLSHKARFGGPRPIDQRLLLENFEADLRQGHNLGWFVADLLLTLGLLGTVIGFILMLTPISSLSGDDHGAIKAALAAMSDGMAVALYTTLTGLIGGMLLKVEGLLLDGAVNELVRRTTQLTEIHVLPVIERAGSHATA